MASLQELKERKLVQWALVYLAGAWLLLQVLDLLAENFNWPTRVEQIATVLLAVGFLAALVLAWFHGEKGAQRVSGVEVGMLAGILVIAGGVVALVDADAEPAAPGSAPALASALPVDVPVAEQGSIAVLPFVNMSSDPEQEYFSEGNTEELLNVLAKLPELRVAARTSAFAFKDTDVGIDSIARALNVRHVLEGSVRRAGDQVRITAQLIDASTGYHLWSETYDRELKDVFAVQDEISREIVDQLQIELAGGRGEGRLARIETSDPEAHQLYLRARQIYLNGGGEPSTWLVPAERLYEQALARDSSYAAAWAGLANVHRVQGEFGLIAREAGLAQAQAEAERALALNPEESDAHLVIGGVKRSLGELSAAGPHYERALQVNPGDARTLALYSRWLSAEGRTEEALRAARRAVELDPLSVSALTSTGHAYRDAADLRTAAQMYERALALVPDDPFVLQTIGMTLVMLGERTEGLRLAERLLEILPHSAPDVASVAWVYAYAREFDRAIELYRRAIDLDPDDPVNHAFLANALAAVGENDEAVRVAERAVELDGEHAYVRTIRAYVYAKAGRDAAARRELTALPEDEDLSRAAIWANLGAKDRAFALLERAVDEKAPGVAELGADWWFDPLRGDPRMDRLLERLGVPEVAPRG